MNATTIVGTTPGWAPVPGEGVAVQTFIKIRPVPDKFSV